MILVSWEDYTGLHLHYFQPCSLKKVGGRSVTPTKLFTTRAKVMGQEIALIPIPNLAPSEVRDDAWRVKPTDNAWNEVNEDFPTSEQRRSERAPSSVQFSSLSGLLTAMGLIFAPVCAGMPPN